MGTMGKRPMNLQEHLENADDLAIVKFYLDRVFKRCNNHFYKTTSLMRILDKLCLSGHYMDALKSKLDDEYHRVTIDQDREQHGNIYYKLDARFEQICRCLQSKGITLPSNKI
jgi:hypothetical protein